MNNLLNEAIKYFKNFENKNLKNLERQFANDIHLKDWDIDIQGKNNVLIANENIFNQFSDIKIVKHDLIQKNNKIVAELSICLDNHINLNVIDVLEFDFLNKITKIYAYKQ